LRNDIPILTWLNVKFADSPNNHQGEKHGHVAGIQGIRDQGDVVDMAVGVIIGGAGSLLTEIRDLLKK
jgi:hypothetical protein